MIPSENFYWARKYALEFVKAMEKLTPRQCAVIMAQKHPTQAVKIQQLWITENKHELDSAR